MNTRNIYMREKMVDNAPMSAQKHRGRAPVISEIRSHPVSIYTLCVQWLIPGLLIAMVVGNQLWMLGPFNIGQMIGWVNGLAAAIIVIKVFRRRLWPIGLVACIILTKIVAVLFASPRNETIYNIFLNVIFCIAGAIIASSFPNLAYKQIMIVCLLNAFMMVVQVTGVGEWTQFLATHGGEGPKTAYSTLFVVEDNLEYSVIQGRPSGLLHANNFQSLIILFAFALHLGRKNAKFAWGNFVLCAMAVLSMAKTVFLGVALIGLLLMIKGKRYERLLALKVFGLAIVFFCIYAMLFPGLYAVNMSVSTLSTSFFYRFNDFIEALPRESSLRKTIESYLWNTPRANYLLETEHITDYTRLIPFASFLIVLILGLTPLFVKGFYKLRARFPQEKWRTVLSLLVVIIYPGATPMLGAQIYWLFAGFALLPLFILLQPQYFKGKYVAEVIDRHVVFAQHIRY